MSLYETLKAAKLGAAPDVLTKLRAQIAPFAKGGSTPTPTEKEIEGTPPLNFTANGDPLIDWIIEGASGGVGDKTDNLFDKDNATVTNFYVSSAGNISESPGVRSFVVPCEPNTKYTVSKMLTNRFILNACDRYPQFGDTSSIKVSDSTAKELSITTGNSSRYIIIMYAYEPGASDPTDQQVAESIMYNEGDSASFEPYGYKISVTCGNETNTIYLDEPLGASDSISMTDTGISIPTVDGSNTLSVGTTVQPSSVYIKYKEG